MYTKKLFLYIGSVKMVKFKWELNMDSNQIRMGKVEFQFVEVCRLKKVMNFTC